MESSQCLGNIEFGQLARPCSSLHAVAGRAYSAPAERTLVMLDSSGQKVTLLSASSVLLLGLSLILPRLIRVSEGFAGATEAALIFFAILAMSFALAVYVLVFALNYYQELTSNQRVFAVLPSILISLTGIIMYISYDQRV